jgi:hypothetical protein
MGDVDQTLCLLFFALFGGERRRHSLRCMACNGLSGLVHVVRYFELIVIRLSDPVIIYLCRCGPCGERA